MILPKYYCEKCKKFRTKKEVVKNDHISCWGWQYSKYECKQCHRPVMLSIKALEKVMEDYYDWHEKKTHKYQDIFISVHKR